MTTNYSPSRFSMQQVFEVLLTDPASGAIVGYLDDLKNSNLTNEATTVYPTGARGNVYIGVGFGHSRRAKLEIQKATWNTSVMAAQVGNDVVVGANTDVYKYELLTVASSQATSTFTALGDVGAEVINAYVVGSDGAYSKTLVQATPATPTAGYFNYAYATKKFTFNATDVSDGDKVAVAYKFNTGTSAQTVNITADKFGKVVSANAFGIVKNLATGEDFQCQVIIPRAKIDDNWSWALGADQEPAVENFNLEILKDPALGQTDLYNIVIYNEADSQ